MRPLSEVSAFSGHKVLQNRKNSCFSLSLIGIPVKVFLFL